MLCDSDFNKYNEYFMKLILLSDCFLYLYLFENLSRNKSLKKQDRNKWSKGKRTKGQAIIYKNTTKKTNDRVTRIPLKTGGELKCSRGTSEFTAKDARLDLNCRTIILVEDKQRHIINTLVWCVPITSYWWLNRRS